MSTPTFSDESEMAPTATNNSRRDPSSMNTSPKYFSSSPGLETRIECSQQLKALYDIREASFKDTQPTTDWFARPVLHVTDVEASLRFLR
jgi:hypothetical protein